jgi:hypothetical protein
MHTWFTNGLLYGNWATDHGIIQACCGREVCITLYAPTGPSCWVPLFEFVIPLLVEHKLIDPEAARKLEAIKATLDVKSASQFEQQVIQTLQQQRKQMDKELPGAPKRERQT